MPTGRLVEIPDAALRLITRQTGPVDSYESAGEGLNSELAGVVISGGIRVFVKGVRGDQRSSQRREAEIAPFLPASCPRVLWHEEDAEWDVLGFTALPEDARHVSFRPGSPDLPLVTDALAGLSQVPGHPAPLQARDRWAGTPTGSVLLHTDLNPSNIMVSGQGVHMIDWAWPTSGPAWIDPYIWAVYLVAHGHEPASADRWAHRLPAWADRDPAEVAAFVDGYTAMWDEIAAHPGLPRWPQHVAGAARAWRAYVLGSEPAHASS